MAVEILRKIKKRPGEPFVFGTVPGKGLSARNIHDDLNHRITRGNRDHYRFRIAPEREAQIREMITAKATFRAMYQSPAHASQSTVRIIMKRMKDGVPIEPPAVVKLAPWTVH